MSVYRLTLLGLGKPVTAEVEISDELYAQIEADPSIAKRIANETVRRMAELSADEMARQIVDGGK